MPSGEGSLAVMIGYLLSSRTGCNLFNWVQRHVLRCEQIRSFMPVVRNVAVTTFMELNTVLWTCYLLLLFVYDNALLGDRHPVAYVVAFGPLFRTLYLFARLIRYKRTGSAFLELCRDTSSRILYPFACFEALGLKGRKQEGKDCWN